MALGLGISFGSKKQSGSATSNTDKTTDLTGTQQQSTSSSGSSTSATTGSQNQTTTQKENTLGTQDQTTSGKTTATTSGTTTSLDAGTTGALADKVKAILSGGITDSNIAGLSSAISGRATAFDPTQFVNDSVAAARSKGENALQESTSSFQNQIGGTSGTNSAAALIAARGRGDLEASIIGAKANAEATAQGIANQNLTTAVGAQKGVADIGTQLADVLKGASTTTDMTQLTDQLQQLIGKTGTLGSTTGSSSTDTSQNTSTTQLLNELAKVLTAQTSHEVGTESQTQKGSSGGLGLSLGI